MASFIKWPKNTHIGSTFILALALLRIVFIPLLLFCNIAPKQRFVTSVSNIMYLNVMFASKQYFCFYLGILWIWYCLPGADGYFIIYNWLHKQYCYDVWTKNACLKRRPRKSSLYFSIFPCYWSWSWICLEFLCGQITLDLYFNKERTQKTNRIIFIEQHDLSESFQIFSLCWFLCALSKWCLLILLTFWILLSLPCNLIIKRKC